MAPFKFSLEWGDVVELAKTRQTSILVYSLVGSNAESTVSGTTASGGILHVSLITASSTDKSTDPSSEVSSGDKLNGHLAAFERIEMDFGDAPDHDRDHDHDHDHDHYHDHDQPSDFDGNANGTGDGEGDGGGGGGMFAERHLNRWYATLISPIWAQIEGEGGVNFMCSTPTTS